MAETLARTSPLQCWANRFRALPDTFRISEEPFVAMIVVRTTAAGAGAVADRIGVRLPSAASTYVGGDDATAIWLGPDEWLITSSSESPATFEADLRAAVCPYDGAAVDVSAQRTSVRISGPHAREVLAQGCSLDLHPREFIAGSAAQTMLGQAGVILMALDESGVDFRILVRSSFANYLSHWLVDAATEFSESP